MAATAGASDAKRLAFALAFAERRGDPGLYPYVVCAYERPLIAYPGQEALFASKRRNLELALAAVDRLVVGPGETFSFQRCIGKPTARHGYARSAALKAGVLTVDTGGAICLASTLLFNIGLLGGMTIVERRAHSVDTYGDRRYFELGRDAAVEHAYIDLRFRNDVGVPMLLRTRVGDGCVYAEARCVTPIALHVCIEAGARERHRLEPEVREDPRLPAGARVLDDPGCEGLSVEMRRRVVINGIERASERWDSVHEARPRRERAGP